MKSIKDMAPNEFIDYCVEKKRKGISYTHLDALFKKNEIDSDLRKKVMKKINRIDEEQKAAFILIEKAHKRKVGLSTSTLLIGTATFAFGMVLFAMSSRVNIIFIFNIAVWAVGGLFIVRGVLTFVAGLTQKR